MPQTNELIRQMMFEKVLFKGTRAVTGTTLAHVSHLQISFLSAACMCKQEWRNVSQQPCVCVCESERGRERECVCVCVRERGERKCVCVCMCVPPEETNNVVCWRWRRWSPTRLTPAASYHALFSLTPDLWWHGGNQAEIAFVGYNV